MVELAVYLIILGQVELVVFIQHLLVQEVQELLALKMVHLVVISVLVVQVLLVVLLLRLLMGEGAAEAEHPFLVWVVMEEVSTQVQERLPLIMVLVVAVVLALVGPAEAGPGELVVVVF
jgi:hypothetical protein